MSDEEEAEVEFVNGIRNTLLTVKFIEIMLALKTKQDANIRATITPPLKYL